MADHDHHRPHHHRALGLGTVALLLAGLAAGPPSAGSAAAAPAVAVTAPAAVSAPVGVAVGIPGITVSGFGPSDPVRVQISVSTGAMWLPAAPAGVTVPLGFAAVGVPWSTLSFEGSQDALNSALDDLRWTSSQLGPAAVMVDATLGGAAFDPASGHHYQVVTAPDITWDDARVAAEAASFNGLPGYLATLTSAAEQELVARTTDGAAWIGASDRQTEGTWEWVTGPDAPATFWDPSCGVALRGDCPDVGYASWADGQPDDTAGVEDVARFDAPAGSGWWDDATGDALSSPSAYLVEFGGTGDAPTFEAHAAGQLLAVTVPGAPTAVTAQPGEASVTVSWTKPAGQGWAAITGYTVSGTPTGSCDAVAPDTTCTVTGLNPGWAYSFVVTARNAVGRGPASSSTGLVTIAAPPPAPSSTSTPPTDPGGSGTTSAPTAGDGGDGGAGGGTETVIEPTEAAESDGSVEGTTAAGDSGEPRLNVVFAVGLGTPTGETRVLVRGGGLRPRAATTITVHSSPILLGTVVTDADGSFDENVVLPADLEDGEHTIVVRGRDRDGSDRSRVMPFAVEDGRISRIGLRRPDAAEQAAADAGAPTDATVEATGEVADDAPAPTGGGSKLPLVLLALLVLAAGGGVLVARRRRAGTSASAAAGSSGPDGGSNAGSRRPHRPTRAAGQPRSGRPSLHR